ncbi:CDGSH iron-sulfur domain-containing protein [Williamsia sterculiae]|uniref:Iron-binding zinc finger CDGSH type n=1 Tax=Williamsia sterculiae TaxID=1344003 RepID=A0A1N7F5Q1_9NOCA|nr:CDGSH iron-sulfur domain-containing protein [Williamsia sterculiae]SIR95582.1 Iron-binding zinc finger CDGSH type [Williamsia sterculiae]
MNSGQVDDADDRRADEVSIVVCERGPLLVSGPMSLLDSDGNPIPTHRSTVALCRCGRTSLAPFCDGSHKLRRDKRRDR